MRRAVLGHPGPREKLSVLAPEALSDEELLALVQGYGALRRIEGMGAARAAALVAARELVRRESRKETHPVLDSPQRILERIPPAVLRAQKEHFLAIYLNARYQFLTLETVSIGTLSASLIHPREVFAPAIANVCAALVVAHNHPSGDTQPSREDRDATRRLMRSGELLGIPLLDHLIVAEGGFFSFRENGLL